MKINTKDFEQTLLQLLRCWEASWRKFCCVLENFGILVFRRLRWPHLAKIENWPKYEENH